MTDRPTPPTGSTATEPRMDREIAYLLDSTLEEAVLAGGIRLDARGRRAVSALLEGTGYRIAAASPSVTEPIHCAGCQGTDYLGRECRGRTIAAASPSVTEPETPAAPRYDGRDQDMNGPWTVDDLLLWMRHDPPVATDAVKRLSSLLKEWADAWAGPSGDPFDHDNGALNSTRAGLYDETRAVLSEAAAPPQEREGIDTDKLGFRDLLDIADAILTKYPPDSIVCSHSVKADKGALTTAAIADLVASCRLSAASEPGEDR